MKKAIILTVIGLFFITSVFALTNTKVRKDSPLINKGAYLAPQEKAPSLSNPDTGIKNSFSLSTRDINAVLIDSSSNGYGMVVSSTRPIDRDEDNWIIVYRQYAGENTTHGQLGSAWTEDIDDAEDWTVYTNINANGNPEWGGGGICEDGTCAQGRYPSAAASEEYPYGIWNEYTGQNSTYGGRPYYTYDEFGWDGDSYAYPINIDLDWQNSAKDQWVGSAQYSFDSDMDMGVMNVAYNDWTRNSVYLFHSEIIEDGLIIFGSEQDGLNLPLYFGDSGYITSPLVTTNDNGDGALAVLGIFNGWTPDGCVDADAHTCNHVPIFKLTDDHGYTWYGDSDYDNHYFIPDAVFDDIWDNNIMPNSDDIDGDGVGDGYDLDYCINYDLSDHAVDYDGDGIIEEMELAGQYELEDWWSWYDWDLRVDADGDIHAIMSIVPQSLDYVHYMEGSAGFYYLTCDKEDIENPGEVNSDDGWRWSYLIDGADTWMWDVDGDGYSEIYNTTPQLSFADDDDDVVWAVINMAQQGDYVDEQTEEVATSCANWDTYIPSLTDFTAWSLDIWVLKSIDGGSTWSDPVNATDTAGDFSDGAYNGPEEMYPHTPAYSTSENVYFVYQMPNWEWNEIGDPAGPDHMNYVYVGFSDGSSPDLGVNEDDSIEESIIPGNFKLTQNYPNPFNPSTSINFTVPSLSDVNISVYDINGRLVNTLISSTLSAGTYNVVWDGDDMSGNNVSAGIYMYNLTSRETSITNKMILVK